MTTHFDNLGMYRGRVDSRSALGTLATSKNGNIFDSLGMYRGRGDGSDSFFGLF